jgi:hypothetical protein
MARYCHSRTVMTKKWLFESVPRGSNTKAGARKRSACEIVYRDQLRLMDGVPRKVTSGPLFARPLE